MDLETRNRKHAAEKVLRSIRQAERNEAKAARPKSVKARVRDFGFLNWLHDDIPCIACVIEGVRPTRLSDGTEMNIRNVIEAAHQKHIAGKGGMLGKRPDDLGHTCPLCAWHHRLAPNACDPAQRKFWDRLGVDVAAFCAALADAYRNEASGREVVKRFADKPRAPTENER